MAGEPLKTPHLSRPKHDRRSARGLGKMLAGGWCQVKKVGWGLGSLVIENTLVGDRAVAQAGWSADRSEAYCFRCGSTAGAGSVTPNGCPHCRSVKLAWDRCVRLGAYQPPLSRWVVQMKFGRLWPWCRWFGEQLARTYAPRRCGAGQGPSEGEQKAGLDQVVVTAVPLHWRRRLGRGYDQAELIGRALAERAGLEYAPMLRRRRHTRTQSQIHGHADRLSNVHGAFEMAAVDLVDWSVVLVDDVKTSGSTAAQCSRLLRRAGARRVDLVVIAVTDPHGSDFQRT